MNNIQSVKDTVRRIDSRKNSAMTETSRTLRSRRNSVTSDFVETSDKHAAIVTTTKKRKTISDNSEVNKYDKQISFSKQLKRADSEAESLSTITRPTRRTRASSMEPKAVKKNDVIDINNSSDIMRKQRSPLPSQIIQEKEETMTSIVALDHVLPNLNEIKETCSDNFTIDESNISMSISKETFNSSSENTCTEEIEADAKKEHTTPAEHPSAKTLQENETDMSINKNTLSDISEKSRSDSTDTIIQMKTSILDVPKTQSRISTEVTPRKLRLKNKSLTNNSINEEDEHLSNKENRASNIIEEPQSKDLTVSNILSHSPQPLIVSDVCSEKSVKENDEDTDSLENTQHLIVTDTELLSETPFNDSIGLRTSCEISILDENIQILKCPENVDSINSLSPLNNDEVQNALSVDIRDDSNEDRDIQIQKCEENINDTHTDKCFALDNTKKEQIQNITSEDEIITKDENVEMRLILEAEETANIDKEESKEVCLTQIPITNAKCKGNNEVGVSNTPENLNNTGIMEYSKLSDMSIDKISTSLIISTNETTTNDLQETEVAAKVPSHESITKEPFDVHTQSNNFEMANENENTITNVIGNSHPSNVSQSLVKPVDNALEKVDVTQNTSKVDNCMASEEKSIIDSNSQNDIEKNEIPETVEKQKEKMQVDDNHSDSHIDTDLFKDITADEWKGRNSDKNSAHWLENESENECDDFVLVDKEVSETAENRNVENEKEAFNYDSDDTVVPKTQKDAWKEKTVEKMDMSKSQCKTNENKSEKVKYTQQSVQLEEIIETEAKSENQKEHVENQTEQLQNAENISMRTLITNEVSKQSRRERDTSIENSVDTNLTNEINQNLDTESSLNKGESKSKLSEDVSNDRISLCKSLEKSDNEVMELSEVDTEEEMDSLSKTPIGSPSYLSDSSKTDGSMDSDIEREYNLNGVQICQFSDDDVPGDECRASETESSDPDDNGSDLADFVVNDEDEISEEEVESGGIDEQSYNSHDDNLRESDKDEIDEQRRKLQMQDESDEKTMKNGKQRRIDRGISKKEKSKSKNKIKDKKWKRYRIDDSDDDIFGANVEGLKNDGELDNKKVVEGQEVNEEEMNKKYRKVQMHGEIVRKLTKKGLLKRGVEENVHVIQNKLTDTSRKEKSKLGKTKILDLCEMLESGKNIKRKYDIETSNNIKNIKAEDNNNTMQKENAIPTWKKSENPTVKSNKMKVSRKRVRNLLEEVSIPSDITMNTSKKRKLLNPEDLPSCSILDSVIKTSDKNFTSLSIYGSTTNFYVTNIQKLKKRKNALEIQLHRQKKMVNRKARLSNYIMFLEKRRQRW